jgi:DNA-binding response OmpR family regulator
MAIKILIVDDSAELTLLLQKALSREGYQVEVADNGLEGLRQAHDLRPDLVLLDIMMPGMSGFDMLSRLREFSTVPVIMLTALGEAQKKIHGLDKGADDYVTKPFNMDELKARIRATLRRAALASPDEDQLLSFDGGQLVIDPLSQRVAVQGEPVALTPTEYKLLLCLARNAGQVLTNDQILDQVWGPGYEGNQEMIKVHIRRLRAKIEADPDNPRHILTQRGSGYCLAKI